MARGSNNGAAPTLLSHQGMAAAPLSANLAEPLELSTIVNLGQLGIPTEHITVSRVALDGDRTLAVLSEATADAPSSLRLVDIASARCAAWARALALFCI